MKTTWIAAALAFGLAACAPHPVKIWAQTSDAPKPGDEVKIETAEGDRYRFKVTKVDDRAFHGIASNDKVYRVPFKVVKSLWIRSTETEWVPINFPCCAVIH